MGTRCRRCTVRSASGFPVRVDRCASVRRLGHVCRRLRRLPSCLLSSLSDFMSCCKDLRRLIRRGSSVVLCSNYRAVASLTCCLVSRRRTLKRVPSSLRGCVSCRTCKYSLSVRKAFVTAGTNVYRMLHWKLTSRRHR